MVAGTSLSFGVSRRETRQLEPVILACRYLGLAEVAPEAADLVLDESVPPSSLCNAKLWLSWKDLTIYRQGSWLLFIYGSWRVAVDLARRRVTPLALPTEDDLSGSYTCCSYIRLVLLFLLRRLGWFELHGGACVTEEQAYVFIGASGSGKTSAVIGLLEAGWRYVSDDALLVKQIAVGFEETALYARAARELFSITTDSLRQFPHLQPYVEPRLQNATKRVVNPRAVWPGRFELVAKPAFLFFCQLHNAEQTQVSPLSSVDALSCLITNTPWLALDCETAETHLATYRQLVKSCYRFTLRMGRDLLRHPSALADRLDAASLIRLHHAYV